MNLPIIIPHTLNDTPALLKLLDWIGELGGAKKNKLHILSDCRVAQAIRDRVEKKAKPIFAGVKMWATPVALGEEAYPIGPNWMFETALKKAQGTDLPAFLYLHPDCTPTRPTWLADIEAMFARCGRAYMGQVYAGPNGVQTLGPIGVFQMPAAYNLTRYTAGSKKQLWHTKAGADVASIAHNTQLIISAGKPIKGLHELSKACAVFHPDKSGSLREMLRAVRNGSEEESMVEQQPKAHQLAPASAPASTPTPPASKSTEDLLAELEEEEVVK